MMMSVHVGENISASEIDSQHCPKPNSPESTSRRDDGHQRVETECNHQEQMSRVGEINRQLDDMKGNLIKTSVRCHMLEVDLATQFSPYMVDTLRNVKEECDKCKLLIKPQERSAPNINTTECGGAPCPGI